MALTDRSAAPTCAKCDQTGEEFELQRCQICRSLFCHRCAVEGFGRYFCSDICRGFFFHGDGDETEEDF
jgi:hypothetical protein